MNESEIRSLTGPKLDAAIAEMMGWKRGTFSCSLYTQEPCWFRDTDSEPIPIMNWHPSTSWADLGVVVAWMEGEGWEHSHRWFVSDSRLWKWEKGFDKYETKGSTLPKAACRAALLTRAEESK